MNRAVVVGAGTMGNGIAHVFALADINVTLVDVSAEALERGLRHIQVNMDRQVKKGALNEGDRDRALSRIATADSMTAAQEADIVVEAATEAPDIKFRIFQELDRAAPPGVILASNTSSISITEIAGKTARAELVIGMHFMNPVPVMPLVEVIRG